MMAGAEAIALIYSLLRCANSRQRLNKVQAIAKSFPLLEKFLYRN